MGIVSGGGELCMRKYLQHNNQPSAGECVKIEKVSVQFICICSEYSNIIMYTHTNLRYLVELATRSNLVVEPIHTTMIQWRE